MAESMGLMVDVAYPDALYRDMVFHWGWIPREHVTSGGRVFLGYYPPDGGEENPYVYDPVCDECGCLRDVCWGPAGYDDLAPDIQCRHWESGCLKV